MYIRGCQSDDFLLPWILQLGQFEVVEIVNMKPIHITYFYQLTGQIRKIEANKAQV